MKWPWTRPEADTTDDATMALEEATEALEEATQHLHEAQALWPEVRRVVASLRESRERNGFAESIELIIRGGHP